MENSCNDLINYGKIKSKCKINLWMVLEDGIKLVAPSVPSDALLATKQLFKVACMELIELSWG